MILYTIGFTQKSAQEFFGLLKQNGVECVVDIRLKPSGQLSGFAKQEDLPYFLNELAGGCAYLHMPILAPTKEILEGYRSHDDWPAYEKRFEQLMDERGIPGAIDQNLFETKQCCLLCSEATSEKCHRRLIADRLASFWGNVQVVHL